MTSSHTSDEPIMICPICKMPVDFFYGSFNSGYRCFTHGKIEPVQKKDEEDEE